MKKKGFTLVELIVVMALVAILSVTIGITAKDQFAKAKDTKAIATLGSIRAGAEIYLTESEYEDLSTGKIFKIFKSLNGEALKLLNVVDFKNKEDEWLSVEDAEDEEPVIEVGGARPTEDGKLKVNMKLPLVVKVDEVNKADSFAIKIGKTSEEDVTYEYDTRGEKWDEY